MPADALNPRLDLPREVLALAERLGVPRTGMGGVVRLTQTGEMWFEPGGTASPFVADQTIFVNRFAFTWNARLRLGWLIRLDVADYMTPEKGGLRAKLFGLFPLFDQSDAGAFFLGEGLRYLAELIWNPDAILLNRGLDWRVLGADAIAVSARFGARAGSALFQLNGDGDIIAMKVEKRPKIEGGKLVERPWFGRCGAYRWLRGRRLPSEAEIGWLIDGMEFVYWRAKIESWDISEENAGR